MTELTYDFNTIPPEQFACGYHNGCYQRIIRFEVYPEYKVKIYWEDGSVVEGKIYNVIPSGASKECNPPAEYTIKFTTNNEMF